VQGQEVKRVKFKQDTHFMRSKRLTKKQKFSLKNKKDLGMACHTYSAPQEKQRNAIT